MQQHYDRRRFIRISSVLAAGAGILNPLSRSFARMPFQTQGRIGIIGLDTSHSTAFVKALNGAAPAAEFKGYKVVALIREEVPI